MKRIINKFRTKTMNTTDKNPIGTRTLYSSVHKNAIIEGVELPKKWSDFDLDELRSQARNAILDLSKTTNPDFIAKRHGFKDAKHLIDLCFNYILK